MLQNKDSFQYNTEVKEHLKWDTDLLQRKYRSITKTHKKYGPIDVIGYIIKLKSKSKNIAGSYLPIQILTDSNIQRIPIETISASLTYNFQFGWMEWTEWTDCSQKQPIYKHRWHLTRWSEIHRILYMKSAKKTMIWNDIEWFNWKASSGGVPRTTFSNGGRGRQQSHTV